MTARLGRAPEPVALRAIQAAVRRQPDLKQQDLADRLECDRSRIGHQLAGRQAIPIDELADWCDVLGTVEPIQVIASRVGLRGYRVVPVDRDASPVTLERGSWELLGQVSAFGKDLASALEDSEIDPAERLALRASLVAVRELLDGMLARLPVGDR